MMNFDEKTTLRDIVDWMNRWLKLQRTVAECYAELPTVYAAYTKFTDAVRPIIEKCGRDLEKEFAAHASWETESYKGQDIWMRTLCFFDFSREHFYLLAWFNGEKRVLLDFIAACKDFAEGDDNCHAVVSIGLPEGTDGDTTVFSVLSKTAWEQFELEPDVAKRWLAAPDEFSGSHAICPACGAPVHQTACGGYGDYPKEERMTCDYCGWRSHKQYRQYDVDKFTNKEGFTAEVKYLRKQQRTEGKKQEALETIDSVLRNLESMWKSHQYTMSDAEYLRTLDKIQDKVEKARQAQKGKH